MEEEKVKYDNGIKKTYIITLSNKHLINKGKTYLHSICFSSAGGDGYITLYDGNSESAPLLFFLCFTQQNTYSCNFSTPVEFTSGMFFSGLMSSVMATIQYSF